MEPAAFVGFLYLVMLTADLPLVGSFGAHDVLFPVLIGFFLLRFRELGRLFRFPDVWLLGFGAWAVLASLIHLHGRRDLYQFGYAAYLGLLYLFFSRTRFRARHLWFYGVGVGAAMWLVGAYQLGAGGFGQSTPVGPGVLLTAPNRFRFTFDSSRLFGSFVALPLVCALIGLTVQQRHLSRRGLWQRLALVAVLFGPALVLSGGRHALLVGGLFLGWLTVHSAVGRRLRLTGYVLFGGAALLCYLTVWIPLFPLHLEAPFVAVRPAAPPTIPQGAYARMLFLDLKSFLFGTGPTHARALYPTLVNPSAAQEILGGPANLSMLRPALDYLPAHCAYLGVACAFGVPAMLACYAFVIALARYVLKRCPDAVGSMMLYAVAAILAVSLWDDILSRRWIWVALGILASRTLERPVSADHNVDETIDTAA